MAEREFAGGHDSVKHRDKEFARGDVTTNTIEGVFSLIKRGIYGTFHSVSKKHLHRYLAEFDFRYNTRKIDYGARTSLAIKRADRKRLLYKEPLVRMAHCWYQGGAIAKSPDIQTCDTRKL
jgi:hypothetical protein